MIYMINLNKFKLNPSNIAKLFDLIRVVSEDLTETIILLLLLLSSLSSVPASSSSNSINTWVKPLKGSTSLISSELDCIDESPFKCLAFSYWLGPQNYRKVC